jgi:PPIC-type PPIASE domain
MIYHAWIWVLLGGLAWGQAAAPQAPQKPAAPGTTSTTAASPSTPPQLPPDAPVITIQGLCPQPPADPGKKADCKTIITREKFDRLVAAFIPNAPPSGRRQLASQYASALVMANEALKEGLDKTARFQETLEATRLGLLAKELQARLQEQAGQISDQDVEDYYHKNETMFQEVNLQRIFVPLRKQFDPPKEKLTDEQTKKMEQDSEAEMKKEADSARARAAAGEDFVKLQQEVYTFAGLKTPPPSTQMTKVRHSSLPSAQTSVFELKTGDVSEVFTGPTGYTIYKVGEKDAIPLDKAKPDILSTVRAQRLQELRHALEQSATTELNEAYFATPGTAAPPSLAMPPSNTAPK